MKSTLTLCILLIVFLTKVDLKCIDYGDYQNKCKSFDYCKSSKELVCGDGSCGQDYKYCPQNGIIKENTCFYTATHTYNRIEALKFCAEKRAVLATVYNNSNLTAIMTGLSVDFDIYSHGFLIDGYSDDLFDFRFEDNLQFPIDSSLWCSNEPNNNRGSNTNNFIVEQCLCMKYESKRFCINDCKCDSTYYPLCSFELKKCSVFYCNCPSSKYWDGSKCVPKKLVNIYCTADAECNDNLGLKCESHRCKCINGTQWNTSIGKCTKCLDGWYHFMDHCYLVLNEYRKHSNALEYCKQHNSTLVDLIDQHKFTLLKHFVHFIDKKIWISATMENNTFYWLNRSILVNHDYKWCRYAPNFYNGNQFCVAVEGAVCFNDRTCDDTDKIVVCERKDLAS